MNVFVSFYSVNWLSILAATLAAIAILSLWFSPAAFGRPWRSAAGLISSGGRNLPLIMSTSFVLMWLSASALAAVLGPDADLRYGAGAGLLIGSCFIGTALGLIYIIEKRPARLYVIDAGFLVVAFVAMGSVLGAFA